MKNPCSSYSFVIVSCFECMHVMQSTGARDCSKAKANACGWPLIFHPRQKARCFNHIPTRKRGTLCPSLTRRVAILTLPCGKPIDSTNPRSKRLCAMRLQAFLFKWCSPERRREPWLDGRTRCHQVANRVPKVVPWRHPREFLRCFLKRVKAWLVHPRD